MSNLGLYFLGTPRIEIAQQPVVLTRRKSLALLAYLAVTGEEQRRDSLATLFWPDHNQSRARGALRRELSKLGSVLGVTWLEVTRETVTLSQGKDVWFDVADFGACLAGAVDDAAGVAQLTQAVSLYRDDFLTGFSLSGCPEFDAWQLFQAEDLRRKLAAALETLVRLYDEQEDYTAAIPYAVRRVALDPLYEPGQRALMRLYALSSQPATALRQYEEFVRLLAEEVGAPPTAETVALMDSIRGRQLAPSGAPPAILPALPTATHPLPMSVTPLVGREAEVQHIVELLARSDCRLLTITGAGGMGKTRLALAAAEQARTVFGVEVCYVPLASAGTAAHLLPALALALKLTEGQTGDLRQRLEHFLRARRLVLVLDNFEHLLEGVEQLASLLHAAPGLKLLVTSRERLSLSEEWVFPLQGLPYPPQAAPHDEREYAAIDLFQQRARQIRPDFSVQEEWNGAAAICRLVEGMPLGVELAATWVHMMSCAEIADELAHNIDFLRTTLRDVSPQHRSLRAVFERSWDLLSAEEQCVLAALSVFQGGFSRAAAAAVAGATVPLLARLVDCSLVHRQPSGRFDMHELLRQFASAKLAAMLIHGLDASQAVRHRHLAYYSEYLAQMSWYLHPTERKRLLQEERVAFQQFAADIDNTRVAWAWAVEQRDAAAIRLMMGSLFQYYDLSGAVEEGMQVFDQAIAAFESDSEKGSLHPTDAPTGLIGSLLLRKGGLICIQHDKHTEAYESLTQSLTLLRRAYSGTQDTALAVDLAFALMYLGNVLSSVGQNQRAAELLAEGVARIRALAHWLGVGFGFFQWGMVAMRWGRMGEAQRVLDEGAAILEPRSEYLHMEVTFMLANVCNFQGRYQEGETLLLRVLDGYTQLAPYHQVAIAFTLRTLGDLLASTGDFNRAKQYFHDARAHFDRVGTGWNVDLALLCAPGVIARLEGDFGEAERLLTQALAIARRIDFGERIVITLHNLAALRYDQARYDEAKTLLDEALGIARRSDSRSGLARVLCRLGYTVAAQRQPEAARQLFREALEIAQREQIHRVALDALAGVAALEVREAQGEQALDLIRLVLAHPATDFEAQRTAQHLHTKLVGLPRPDEPEHSEQSRCAELHAAIDKLLGTSKG